MTISGKKFKLSLRGAGLTQEAAAQMLGVTRQTIGNWVNRESLDDEILQDVKNKLGIDLQNDNNENQEPKPSNYMQSQELLKAYKKIIELQDQVQSLKDEVAELRSETPVKGKSIA